ncbi:MAG TPA: Rieske 2Fe-2S domain-containing protein [Steroidobacteraceae bacterium]|nr:Rieske 2Fe-2S domain-containing protein [Steroidobacteraceae bacterium]HNS27853.1 Rieske 2Fe-2S domain-containing protein [Steroidobacteraceae bacterium]
MDLRFAPVAALEDLRPGHMHACMIQGREVLVCHTREGVYAVDNICTHAFARLHEGRLRGTRLVCPLHGASFDVRDGRVLKGPASEALPAHAVRVTEGVIEVAVDPSAPPQPSED